MIHCIDRVTGKEINVQDIKIKSDQFIHSVCPGCVVHCGTYKEAHKFLNQCRAHQIDAANHLEKFGFREYGESVAFLVDAGLCIQCAHISFFKEHGYPIIEYSEIYKESE